MNLNTALNYMAVWMIVKYKLDIKIPIYLSKYIDISGFYDYFINEYLPKQGINDMKLFIDCNFIVPLYLKKRFIKNIKQREIPTVECFFYLDGIGLTTKNIVKFIKKRQKNKS